jgi:integrase
MTRAKRTRITLAEGIYQDAHGISVIARLGSGTNLISAPPVRFPLVDGDGVPYSKQNNVELVMCRLQMLEDLRRKRARSGGEAGSLGAAIDAWKTAFPLTPDRDGTKVEDKRADDHRLLAHWRSAALAADPVTEIKRSQIRAQLTAWTDAGRAPTTVNHRMRALTMVLRWALEADDDEDITIPTEGIQYLAPREPEARGILMPVLVRILATMSDRGRAGKGESRPDYSENKIRMRVMSWTGLARMSLIRLERRQVNFREGKLFLPLRKKGKGAAGVWVDLLPPGLDALRDFDRARLWGRPFSRSSMRKGWKRAVVNTQKALEAEAAESGDRTMLEQFLITVPANSRPYDTRHSFLSDVYRQTGDIRAVQELGQHKSLKTTDRYTKAAVPERVALAIEKMRARWFPETPKPGATVRDFHVIGGTK